MDVEARQRIQTHETAKGWAVESARAWDEPDGQYSVKDFKLGSKG